MSVKNIEMEGVKPKPIVRFFQLVIAWFVEYFFRGLYLAIGICISWYLLDRCLYCQTCNSIVLTFFSIIGLACFANVGLPIDKIINSSILPS